MKDSTFKTLILIAVILYVVSPVDMWPGLLDDIIVVILGAMARKSIAKREYDEYVEYNE